MTAELVTKRVLRSRKDEHSVRNKKRAYRIGCSFSFIIILTLCLRFRGFGRRCHIWNDIFLYVGVGSVVVFVDIKLQKRKRHDV